MTYNVKINDSKRVYTFNSIEDIFRFSGKNPDKKILVKEKSEKTYTEFNEFFYYYF